MAKLPNPPLIPSCFTLLLLLTHLVSMVAKLISTTWKWTSTSLASFFSNDRDGLSPLLHVAARLRVDPEAVGPASIDFGRVVTRQPVAVFHPSSVDDIVSLVKFSYNLASPFAIAAKGRGHSLKGQAMAENGVVVEMGALNKGQEKKGCGLGQRIRVFRDSRIDEVSPNFDGDKSKLGFCGHVDVGGEQLWIDVLSVCLEHGLAPVSWTDYLYLSVGGTLSNGGISGQTFRYGPQINNVYELDVVTGKGEVKKCSREENSELFYGVLGGLGQFGIISRARIALQPAPKRVKWIRMMYDDFETFKRDQEFLISNNKDVEGILNGLNYVEGTLLMPKISPPNNWRSSFFTLSDQLRIGTLNPQSGIIYCLEVGKYYDPSYNQSIDQEVEELLKGFNFLPEFIFTKDISFVEFLNRVREGEIELQSKGLWDVPHPWLNLFIPRSQISDFNRLVFVNIIAKQAKVVGPMLVYPMNRNKWDDKMSTMIPKEEVFYTVGMLHSSGYDEWRALDDQNAALLKLCEENGIEAKQYLPHFFEGLCGSKEEFWRSHFGKKWRSFEQKKARFDPKMILSPGQGIFN